MSERIVQQVCGSDSTSATSKGNRGVITNYFLQWRLRGEIRFVSGHLPSFRHSHNWMSESSSQKTKATRGEENNYGYRDINWRGVKQVRWSARTAPPSTLSLTRLYFFSDMGSLAEPTTTRHTDTRKYTNLRHTADQNELRSNNYY